MEDLQRRNVEEVTDFGLLKIDIQRRRTDGVPGCPQKLAEAVEIHAEVSFVPLHEDQAAFGDVNQELRRQGLIPHAFAAVKRWPIAPEVFGGDFRRARLRAPRVLD